MSASLSMPLQSLNMPNLTFGTVAQQPKCGTGNTGNNESLLQVLQQLVQALTGGKSGSANTDSPLAKMLQKFLDQSSGSSSGSKDVGKMSSDELLSALSDMIKSKLGNNVGSDSSSSGSSDSGGGDLLAQVLGGLAKSSMDSMLKSDGKGGSTFTDADKPTLTQVARFMDDHPDDFPKPDNANGTTKSWSAEVNNEDLYMNSAETGQFRDAMSMIGQQLSSGNAQGAGALGGGNGLSLSGNSGGTGGLGQLGGGQQVSGNQGNSSNELNELKMLLGMMSMQQEIQNLQQQQNGGTQSASNDSSTDDLVDELLLALLSNKVQQHSNHGHAGGHGGGHRSPVEGGHGPVVQNPAVGAPTLGGSLGGGNSQSLTSGAQTAAGNVLASILG